MNRLIHSLVPEPLRKGASVSEDLESHVVVICTERNELRLEIDAYLGSLGPYSLRDFLGIPVYTHFVGERQVASLRFSGKRTDTIGYIFPIAALHRESQILEEKYPALFAAAATRLLLSDDKAPLVLARSITHELERLQLADLFPDNVGVAVFSREMIDASGQDVHTLSIALQTIGLVVYKSDTKPIVQAGRFPYEKRYALPEVSSAIVDDAPGLHSILATYAGEERPTARFLGYYQILEYLISRVFNAEMKALVADKKLIANPWDLREKINSISAERARLSYLAQKYCRVRDGSVFDDCANECVRFLVANGDLADKWNDPDWAKALYSVRNIVVHRQFSMATGTESILKDVCSVLEQLCFVFITTYEDPAVVVAS